MYLWDQQTTDTLAPAIKQALPWVKGVRFRQTLNADGESVLVIYLVVDSTTLQDAPTLTQARRHLSALLRQQKLEFWPHLRFITQEDATNLAS